MNVISPISVLNLANIAMEEEGLAIKDYIRGDKEAAIRRIKIAIQAIEALFEVFHKIETPKWPTWHAYERLICYPHTHDLLACVLSLLEGKGERIVRPFADFGAHNKHVSLYQHKRGNANFPFLFPHK